MSSWNLELPLLCACWITSIPERPKYSGRWITPSNRVTPRRVSQSRTARTTPTASAAPWRWAKQTTRNTKSTPAKSPIRAWARLSPRASTGESVRGRSAPGPPPAPQFQPDPLPSFGLWPFFHRGPTPIAVLQLIFHLTPVLLLGFNYANVGGEWVNKVNLCTCGFSLSSFNNCYLLFYQLLNFSYKGLNM